MKYFSTISLLLLITFDLFAQTEIQGGIYKDSTLTKEKSPYHVVGDIVVFPEYNLTIEPGVEIIFQDDYFLEIRGGLVANGTSEDRIIFTTTEHDILIDSLPFMRFDYESEKYGLTVDYPTATIEISYCNFSKFKKALSIYRVNNDVTISNCTFNKNNYGVYYTYWNNIDVENCLFEFNSVGGIHIRNVRNSEFINNIFGLKYPQNVYNSQFVDNSIGIFNISGGLVKECELRQNIVALVNSWSDAEMKDNRVFNNQIGVRFFHLSQVVARGRISSNQFCNNSEFNIENIGPIDMPLNGNCWCSSDSTTIENKIYDGYNDIASGLVNYDIYNESCSIVMKSVTKFIVENDDSETDKDDSATDINTGLTLSGASNLEVFPNPFNDVINVSLKNTSILTVRLYDLNGKVILNQVFQEGDHFLVNTRELKSGLYFMELNDGKEVIRKKLMKQ